MFYKVIPARPVMGHEVFQAARKSEKEIAAMKGSHIQEYYRSLVNVDSFLSLFCFLFFVFAFSCGVVVIKKANLWRMDVQKSIHRDLENSRFLSF